MDGNEAMAHDILYQTEEENSYWELRGEQMKCECGKFSTILLEGDDELVTPMCDHCYCNYEFKKKSLLPTKGRKGFNVRYKAKAYQINHCPNCPNFDYLVADNKASGKIGWCYLLKGVEMPFKDMRNFGIHKDCPLVDYRSVSG